MTPNIPLFTETDGPTTQLEGVAPATTKDIASNPTATAPIARMRNRVQQYLRGIPPANRARIRALYREKNNGTFPPLNRTQRELLASCIFAIENAIESEGNGHPHDPRVVAMRKARNEVYDDLGWNESNAK